MFKLNHVINYIIFKLHYSLVGDGANVTILQKQKRQPVKKKPTRWSSLEWRRQLHTDPDEF
jgi:hypothetical protein